MRILTKRQVIKKNQRETVELKNIMNEIQNAMENINSRLNQTKERSCEVKNNLKLCSLKNKEKRMKKSEESLCKL